MRYRAVIKQAGEWWIIWLVDLPGVNAQERTREETVESLRIGAREMLETQIPFQTDAMMVAIEVPEPTWMLESVAAS
jgi:predicted RNase H-like HicB family nuclease